MNISKRVIPAAALTVATAVGVLSMPATAVSAAATSVSAAAASAASSSAASSPAKDGQSHPGHRHGGESGAMKILAGLTGTDAKALEEKYPQQTAWQIARKLGKLDALKQEFLSQHKQMFDKLAAAGKITADDSAKMYTDLQKRVAAIDGSETVVLGRPGYRPQRQ